MFTNVNRTANGVPNCPGKTFLVGWWPRKAKNKAQLRPTGAGGLSELGKKW